jgi:hypothetical protein
MTAAYFEEHPTDPDKMILRKPRLDQGADYERGFVDGMQYQMQTSVDKAVNAMSRTWTGLTDEEMLECNMDGDIMIDRETAKRNVEAKLKGKNNV